MTITVSTDGSALGNPNGPMGWGWADHELATGGKPGHHHDSDCDAGGATNGTNQIGELCAVLEALRAHPGSEPLVIETDSQYAINCSTTWVHGWKKNGWKNSQKKPVKNADLIRAIDAEISKRPGPVKFVWVKGHAGNAGNEKVDELARTYAGDCRSKIREGYLPLEGWQSLLASEYSQGTDVPDDAQMLLDGKITTDEYHMGRGQGKSAQGSLADDLMGAADPEPRPRSIADMLVEPEGYPAPDEATLPLTSNEMPVESDDMPEPTTALDTTMPDGTTPDAEAPRKSYAEMLLKPDCFPHEHDERQPADDAQHEQSANSSENTPAPTSESAESANASAPANAVADLPKLPHRASPSGLAVSGTIRFTPPPNSSPTFDGKPRLIRGYIAVEGYVQGDGTLVLDEAPFAVKHN